MSRQLISIALFILFPLLGQAQFLQKVSDVLKAEPNLVVKLDSRNSFITAKSVKMFGLKAGYRFDETLEMGISYNFLTSRIIKDIPTQAPVEGIESFPARLKYRYLALYAEYTFHKMDNWEFSAPFQLGVGTSFYKYRNEFGHRVKTDKGPALSLEPGVEANYYILPYISFGLGIGYRIMLVNNPNIDERFSAPLYVIKLNIQPKPAYEKLKSLVQK